MKIEWNRDKNDLYCGGIHFLVTNKVRNEIDPLHVRKLHDPNEVVYAIENGQYTNPYMPRKFPKGTWQITEIEETTQPDFAPIKIKTNAHQMVEVWLLDDKKGYDKPSGKFVNDSGYHLHWSQNSSTTLGCGRVGSDTDKQVRKLAGLIKQAFEKGEMVILEVI
jgi:hypothetical protein